MAEVVLEKGKIIYSTGQPLTALHLISSGKVEASFPGGKYTLGKGDVIGICELCSEVHFIQYTALEDTSILTYSMASLNALDTLMHRHGDLSRFFLISSFRQISIMMEKCSYIQSATSGLRQELENVLQHYQAICKENRLPVEELEPLDELQDYMVDEDPDLWLHDYYTGLSRAYSDDTCKALLAESSVSMGLLRKCGLDCRKTCSVIEDRHTFRQQIADFYFKDDNRDLFEYLTSAFFKLDSNSSAAVRTLEIINRISEEYPRYSSADSTAIELRIEDFKNKFNPADVSSEPLSSSADAGDILDSLDNSLDIILNYAARDFDGKDFKANVQAFKSCSDINSSDDKINKLRRSLTKDYHNLYTAVAMKSLDDQSELPLAVRMFLYFGFVDPELSGQNNTLIMYETLKNMNLRTDSGFYPFIDWLRAIYAGTKEPSRNEFEQDYSDFIRKQKATNAITEAEYKRLENDRREKVMYELENLFPNVNKIVFGRITTYCPLFADEYVMGDLRESFVTFSKINAIIDQIKAVDYSAYCREGLDTEHAEDMAKTIIHREFLPDFILMPIAGIRGVMWQEIEGKKRNSPGRVILPIFHMESLKTSIIRHTAEFRWEMCKRVQGSRWNDLGERSLTSLFFDYIQFYRKNRDLSTEAKEKIHSALQRSKNSVKEMFVKDYLIWIEYESTGSPRLNKISRDILFEFCPFSADIRHRLSGNPQYSELIHRHEMRTAQRLHTLETLSTKLTNAGRNIPQSLTYELEYIQK